MEVTESPVSAESLSELTGSAHEVFVELAPNCGDSDKVRFIDEALYQWQRTGMSPNTAFENQDLIYTFGAIWGNEVVKTHGWHWASLTFHDFDNWKGMAVVSPDRALFVLPFGHIHECLSGSDEVKIGASLAAINSDVIPPLAPNSYINMLHNIQRILPRL